MKCMANHKHIAFFNLIDAMQLGGCPICLRIQADVRKAIESFLYESVNDPGIRDEIRRDGGLCNRHTWQLADFGDALGGAILFRDVLQSLLKNKVVVYKHMEHWEIGEHKFHIVDADETELNTDSPGNVR